MTTPTEAAAEGIIHLRAAGVSLVLDLRGNGLPAVLHWGADLGDLSRQDLHRLAEAVTMPPIAGFPDAVPRAALLPEHGTGWPGQPGLTGHRQGADWSPLFTRDSLELETAEQSVKVRATDAAARLSLVLEAGLTASGLVRVRAAVRNDDPDRDYTLNGLLLTLPVPDTATELLDLTGRWCRERAPQRRSFTHGTWLRETRSGRTGHDAPLVLAAGTAGFGFGTGEVWGLHLAWSGNHRVLAERLPTGRPVIAAGELLLPGELILAPGEEYTGPWLYASHSDQGLDGLSARFHDHLRSRPGHPDRPRLVVLNTWEAVYFDHDLDRLTHLADRGAEVGVERFVLDDGWFRHRRDDRAGLGDWYVDETVWPTGLDPLIDHVRGLGMEFGLWVEPEMVNPDSDLARAHPEWILATGGRTPADRRFQQVLDLTHPEAYAHILQRLDALLSEYDIAYLKWDHNRELVDPGHAPGGEPAVHAQTLAVYALLDELRARHPGLEIESCASGGGRVDLAILERTDRVCASDCNDALERQSINRWTQLLLPPELIGSHVGAARSHTTGRTHDLAFRAGTALFGHFGIEWDLTRTTETERAELAHWITLYKQLRGLLHTGRVVRIDHPDPALWAHGVISQDRTEAVFALTAMATPLAAHPGTLRLRGLDPDATYHLRPLPPADQAPGMERGTPAWCTSDEITVPGSVLERVGIQIPNLHPEQLLLLRLAKA
ncbi:alpha-galactosidase [Streptomyces canus]|uniref:Alpha-galactosidase n=1 Tax=Streptomyces canus TaxID=58343 RepID=A0AAW8FX30_9ACTN|nr:alpha-galactosidase [Streptomyces canus]MDQ0913525.1 alpha-galactosidase [Streptomyces canus]